MHNETIDIQMLLRRIRSEFREMPGLRLTPAQAQRLFGLDPHHCGSILGALVDAGFLTKTHAGTYTRSESAA